MKSTRVFSFSGKMLFSIGIVVGAFCGLIFSSSNTFAAATVITTLDQFNSAATNGGEYKLGANITLTANTYVRKAFDLDLNGNTLDASTFVIVPISSFTIRDNTSAKEGKITGKADFPIQVGSGANYSGSLTLESGNIVATGSYGVRLSNGSLTINGGVISAKSNAVYAENGSTITMNDGKITASSGHAVHTRDNVVFTMNNGFVETKGNADGVHLGRPGGKFIMNNGKIEALYEHPRSGGAGVVAFRDTEVIINNGTITAWSIAICGNGTNDGTNNDGSRAKFTIKNGNITATGSVAIYAPQADGVVTISGGKITGLEEALELRAGTLRITGGELVATETVYDAWRNTSGTGMKGVAVGINQHTTTQPINVYICGGTFKGVRAFNQLNLNENSEDDIAKITMLIDEPCGTLKFESTDPEITVYSQNFTNFIKGGTYTHETDVYRNDDYCEKVINDKYVVLKDCSDSEPSAIDITTNPETIDGAWLWVILSIIMIALTSYAVSLGALGVAEKQHKK